MFYKILNEDLKNLGFQYQEGLNTDCNEFDPNIDDRGGLFYADEKNILAYSGCGTKIAEVSIPDGAVSMKVSWKEYKSHQIVLSNIRDLWTIETFQWLKEHGVDLRASEEYAIYIASEEGHLEIVKYLIEQGSNIHAKDERALRYASCGGQLDVVRFLVENGADIHALDDTALCLAAQFDHIEVVKYLIEQGANIHAHNDYVVCVAS